MTNWSTSGAGFSERRFLHALNYCMLLPGPEAQQLATYLGWLLHRTRGGIIAGALFVLPSLLIPDRALLAVHDLWPDAAGRWPVLRDPPAVAAIVVHAAHRIGSRTLRNGVVGDRRGRLRRHLRLRPAIPGHRPWRGHRRFNRRPPRPRSLLPRAAGMAATRRHPPGRR